jgi:protein-tyrosine-phosphatase/predicted ATP-grasp superfamily ATP-dependent carboligase
VGKSVNEERVLVLDGERASTLSIVRSLGRRGLQVEVGSSETHPLAALSRYCSDRFTYPDPLHDPSGFQKTILEKLRERRYALAIPVTDLTTCPLMEIRESVERCTRLAMASNDALSVTLSKSRTCDLAKGLGVPIPKTLVIRNVEEFYRMQDKQAYPAVVKPDRSKNWAPNGTCEDISVAYALNLDELSEAVLRLLKFGPVLIQQYLRGGGVGMGVLAAQGETLFAFQYRRLHEVPVTGGAGSYRVSEAIDPELLGYASSLLKGLCWDGVAMVEFKEDRGSRKTYLMEVNGRFWGSLALAITAGADFPSYLFDLIVRQRRDFPPTYKIGHRCRELSREVEWLKEVLLNRRQTNLLAGFPTYRSVLVDSLRLLNPTESSDTFSFRDLRPGIEDLMKIIRHMMGDVWRKLWCFRQDRKMRRIQRIPKSLLSKVRRAKTILIVCQGNVIRSPLAAQFLVESVRAKKPVSIYSAGLEAVPGVPAHPRAISKAKELGIDLSSHVSAPLTAQMVANADLIFVMEVAHLLRMRRLFPDSLRKTFLLGCFSPEQSIEIADPMGRDQMTFETCFGQITKTVQAMASALS